MKYFIYRNSTIEPLFTEEETLFSGYEDISNVYLNSEINIWFYTVPLKQSDKKLAEEISGYFNNLMFVYDQLPQSKLFYVFTLATAFYDNIITGDFSLNKSIAQFNLNIYELAEKNINIKVIDISNFLQNYPFAQIVDWKYYFMSKMPFSLKLAKDFKYWFNMQVEAIELKRKKCIVLDLDNTLWYGILGEDGINGIKIGGDYPGNAFLEFQKSLLEISKTGIILTVCSKNNEEDVLELWNNNPFLLIRKEHFSAYRINWKNKSENIKELAQELNISLDSMIFIDDNPSERELINQLLPMVETPYFPIHPYELPTFTKLLINKYFKVYSVTEEDKTKTEQYKARLEGTKLQKKYKDFSDYLLSLEIEIQMQEANQFNISRLAQLTQKTNQFNLTTKRYTEIEIFNFIQNGNIVYCIDVKDKFGESGITGMAMIKLDFNTNEANIDSFLLSCRILGKGIEDVFLTLIINKLKIKKIKKIHSLYVFSQKNNQVETFYDRIGFSIISESSQPFLQKHYKIDIDKKIFEYKPFYKLIN